ncbi:unnamed protein product [Sphagnum jensenii]|uniref:JmjC domain-containing protein n=1 Tax=Sphagnum jensenii TaxID=128206 RepID=A0ABP0WQ29_9BRYO
MQARKDRRPQGLGVFNVLDDELLCGILNQLAPRTLGTLACVSSVFYILCNEEPLWMQLCLHQHQGGVLQFQNSWRHSTLLKLGFVKKGTTMFKPPMHFDGFSSLFLYRRWYRCHVVLDSFAMDKGVIDRREHLSLKDFQAFYDGKKPVLVTDLTKEWPAQKTWNLKQMVGRYGDVAFKVSQSHGKKVKMKLKDYASYMQSQNDEEPLYIFDSKFGEVAPTMLQDYSVPSIFSEDLLALLDKQVRPPFRWLVAGPARSGASWHVDPALTSAWNALLSGRKRWALYPPGRVPPAVIVHVDEDDGSVNFDGPTSLQWWLDVYPTLRQEEKPLECTQLPGETIFVPSGWWHCVLNIDPSIAVTQNFVNTTNLELVCLDMAPGFHHRGVARAGRLAIAESVMSTGKKDPADHQALAANTVGHRVRSVAMEGHEHVENGKQPNGCGEVLNHENESLLLDVDFLVQHTEEHSNHFLSNTSKAGYLERTELRDWLHRLWKYRPDLHQCIWKCACMALDAGTWLQRVMCICESCGLSKPVGEEQLPVGNGSNPVYLVGNHVIKLCLKEDGTLAAINGLRSQLQFYHELVQSKSSLRNCVPTLIATGILIKDGEEYRALPWDGTSECPSVNRVEKVGKKRQQDVAEDYKITCRAKWSDSQIEKEETSMGQCNGLVNMRTSKEEEPILWPFLVEKRCEGTNLTQLLHAMTKEDYVNLAFFLGEQLRLLHSLPAPSLPARAHAVNQLDLAVMVQSHNCRTEKSSLCNIPIEWQYFVGFLREQRANATERFLEWESMPCKLLEQLESYLPEDPVVLVGGLQICDGVAEMSQPPVWLHMDIMADNIQMVPFSGDNSKACSPRMLQASYILDFGNVVQGDPLFELLALYVSVFKCDQVLLECFLKSYGVPLSTHHSNGQGLDGTAICEQLTGRDSTSLSYRAMCYCLLHEQDIMGAILKHRKDLRMAASLEAVEEKLWAVLNEWEREFTAMDIK